MIRRHNIHRIIILVAALFGAVNCHLSIFDLQLNVASAQTIGGQLYGGGNHGNVDGKTTVHVVGGDIGRVYAGARMGNVGGRAYVYIDGANAESDSCILINQVYGGNDIAGTIGKSADALPAELNAAAENDVTIDWNVLVRISSTDDYTEVGGEGSKTTKDAVFIGSLYGGGNGKYDYQSPDEGDDRHRIYENGQLIAFNNTGFTRPIIDKTYLEIEGGTIGQVCGGGNNATVNEKVVIHVADSSEVINKVLYEGFDKLTNERVAKMGFNTGFTYVHSDAFQIGNFFGGNNKAEMAIQPKWDLQKGKIRNLYSGGNSGAMTCPDGLLLEINPNPYNVFPLIVDNVYGGCRMADVKPTVNGVYTPCKNLPGYAFPSGLSARVLVHRGDINNVYGGNDITGTVYGGNAIGIYTSIRGNVYGGGNGAYAYTDILEGDSVFGDFYFQPTGSQTIAQALNAFRPNAEQVSIRLRGQSPEKPTVVHGSIYVGGNCATLATKKMNPMVELKIGSYVVADSVYLGNNGEMMVNHTILERYANPEFSNLNLTDKSVFASYMEGVCMNLQPAVVFDSEANGDRNTYVPYSSYVGSFFCGGNVGSMAVPGKNVYTISQGLNIYEKFVGGCNNAYVAPQDGLNAAYLGGVLGSKEERDNYTDGEGKIKDRLEINLSHLTITPLRWNDGETQLIWNTNKWDTRYEAVPNGTRLEAGGTYYTSSLGGDEYTANGSEVSNGSNYWELFNDFEEVPRDPSDHDIRLLGGNVYGGCFNSGHVNGNVIININEDMLKRDEVFGTVGPYGRAASGVELDDQSNDVMSVALTVFGAGSGEDTEVWGSTTVNHNKGYTFQIFGGGEEGLVGKIERNNDGTPKLDGEGNYVYEYNPAYSTTVNLKASTTATDNTSPVEDLAETEYIYGGGNEGDVCGDTYVNVGNGRVYDVFGGASNADILGHTEVYIGRQPKGDGTYKDAFPWIQDNVYGGNDFGGTIWGSKDFSAETTRSASVEDASLLEASTYVRYIQGRVDTIVGGNYGGYDYKNILYRDYTHANGTPKAGFNFPHLKDNSFMHFRPNDDSRNWVSNIFAGSEGYAGAYNSNNAMQTETYALIDDTETSDEDRFKDMDIYGGGSYAGVGTASVLGAGRTAIDLFAGKVRHVYGGCNREGAIGYTHVNVPAESTIKVSTIFGGGKGYDDAEITAVPILATRLCDHYVTCVDYQGANAIVEDAIYGGNRNSRIACDTYLNIEAPVMQSSGYQATVYGAGYGQNTVCGRTNIFMNNNSYVYKVFGGGRDGNVFNYASLARWLAAEYASAGIDATEVQNVRLPVYRGILDNFSDYIAAHPIVLPNHTGTYPNSSGVYDGTYTNDILPSSSDPYMKTSYHNTNVHLMEGSRVSGYAYGGGYGSDAAVGGTTYIELKGGTVSRDIYGGGQGGSVEDKFNLTSTFFTPTTNVYIEGGTCRNAYGGGYLGHVGYHVGDLSTNPSGDRHAVANIVVGKRNATSFINGMPAVTRNIYGGGEGGSVYGTANVTINNGYIGYRYKNVGTELAPDYQYVEELDDQKPGDLDLSGNVFGGGYVINSYVDIANVDMYGGTVRGSLYGGGEIGPIGRGTVQTVSKPDWARKNGDATIYKAGQTHVRMFNGHVMRNVFGGGRGKDSWGGDGTMYMDKDLVATLDMKVKGYVFGQTDVNIYGGEVGSDEGLARNFGNVFGGGDEGYVYSAYEQGGNLFVGKKAGARYDEGDEGYYYRHNGSAYVDASGDALGVGDEKFLTEDCHVLVEPWLQVKAPILYNAKTYATGDYIPTSYLNTLPKKAKTDETWPAEWTYVDAGSKVGDDFIERGVIIHNAVFAGGNIAIGSEMFANTKTVFGNATATIHDVYNRDLITIGTGYNGGLYGDGNLTFVDGYRELNITNYGTDYYNIQDEIEYSKYLQLPPREKAYYELMYKCKTACTDNEGTSYAPGSKIPRDELMVLFEGNETIILPSGDPNPAYWTENGVVSLYAGRLMNTIQRADFCGVFGSRMVMKGAKDRVPEVADNTNYTINRVREVSLNKKASVAGDVGEFANHGNYFGIYSVVNYLGALTSDLDFYNAVRVTNNNDEAKYKNPTANGKAYGTATYADWKKQFHKDPRRNNGTSHNELALASGVYLELTTEESTGKTIDLKDWGLITGVVQLDLINVAKGIGGGFVYAKNVHGVREATGLNNTILTALNTGAATNKSWRYVETDPEEVTDDSQEEWQTSGNFIHNSQVIIDDCYNISGRYLIGNRVPAHYWFIRGSVYVYDQYITAHTGSSIAYSKSVELPITISAAANNKMKLMDVQPNLYAYYSSHNASSKTPLAEGQKLLINDVEYYLNTPISYWDWSLLPAAERNLFVEQTYITTEKCKIGSTIYPAGKVMLPSEYEDLLAAAATKTIDEKTVKAVQKVITDEEGNDVVATDRQGDPVYVPFTSVFHSSNDMNHDNGFLLTYKMSNPNKWDTWYTQANSTTHAKRQNPGEGYDNGPTYYLDPAMLEENQTGKLLGQHEYKVADIIPQSLYQAYEALGVNKPSTEDQATFVAAYVVTNECTSAERHYNVGAPVSASVGTALGGNAAPAYVCTASIQLGPTEYIFINDLMTLAQKNALKAAYPSAATDIEAVVVPAYYCTKTGLYGGSYYEAGKNYRALEHYSSMSPADREYFTFNYDAFDVLIDSDYGGTEGQKYQYDSAAGDLTGANKNPAHYSLPTSVNYTASYDGVSLDLGTKKVSLTRSGTPLTNQTTIVTDDVLADSIYESLLNEQHHYAPIEIEAAGTYYVTNESFYYNEPFAAGQVIDESTYNRLPHSSEPGELDLQAKVDQLTFASAGTYYYCRDSYTIAAAADGGKPVKAVLTNGAVAQNATVDAGGVVPVGFVISKDGNGSGEGYKYGYQSLPNLQKNFTIHSTSPMETSTLYISRNADYDDLTKERIITVIYQYDYEESDESGLHITPISERHVVRIHVTFENGIPTVEDIQEPNIVLPGNSVIMRVPGVSANGYEIIGGGWELFEDPEDAESHFSGKEYTPSSEPLYWYQDGFYIAYYAKTYNRGKTYSNAVPVHVANYHDLKAVMDDQTNHLHVDYDRTRLRRESKIYINDYSGSSENGLDLLKDFYDLSMLTSGSAGVTDGVVTAAGRLNGQSLLNNNTASGTNIYDAQTYERGVKGGKNLEFFLRTDINRPCSDLDHWTPIGNDGDGNCFRGTLHGDGHTISGLDNSLFNNLCGDVYNVGVTGSFTSAGVVNKGNGYVESCWTNTTGTPADPAVYAVFGNPSRTAAEIEAKGPVQIVNSYYQEGKTYKTTGSGERGIAKAMPAKAYYDGELAYDLNSFYLNKRYYQGTNQSTGTAYKYWPVNTDGTLPEHVSTGHYPASGYAAYGDLGYVESRFADGDFRYAAGEIPDSEDERYYEWTEVNPLTSEKTDTSSFFPIWPDDYIFFGQRLTFDYNEHPHQEVPTAVTRAGGRLSTAPDANRVYRAPAYYRSKVMGVVHMNPNVYLAAKNLDGTKTAYPNMTAIDFAGHNGANEVNGTYGLGQTAAAGGIPALFYPPLLDDGGLQSITNYDETRNLLVYAPAASGEGYINQQTHDVLNSAFTPANFNDHYDNSAGYKIVDEASTVITGHVVQANLVATSDHLLVDKQDFNAPIAYRFDSGHRMWYQRKPADTEYVDHNKGWQGISLPFTADLVTTSQKGEITHFYSGSESSANGTNKKIGHEYWLRELEGGSEMALKAGETKVLTATFNYPSATGNAVDDKNVTNTFLWDYYYKNTSVHNQKDKNQDTYQEYYSETRSYAEYPRLAQAKPYILGLPGQTYYEFDLSGNFTAENTAGIIEKLDKQIITFASAQGQHINVSDEDIQSNGTTVTYGGKEYIFRPSYMNNMDVTDGKNAFVLNADGNSYVESDERVVASMAFRPYFEAPIVAPVRGETRSIVFSGNNGNELDEEPESAFKGTIEIFARDRNIIARSHKTEPVNIRIVNIAGVCVEEYVLEPGQTVVTPVQAHGTYIVNEKKIFVR